MKAATPGPPAFTAQSMSKGNRNPGDYAPIR
jgi:hypothetical protein